MKIIERYHLFLKKNKIYVLIFWIIVLGFGIWLTPKFINSTSSDFNVPEDTPSYIANSILETEFSRIANETTIVVVIYNENGTSLTSEIRDFCYNLSTEIMTSFKIYFLIQQ